MKILGLNAGSSSQKSCLYDLAGDRLPDALIHLLRQEGYTADPSDQELNRESGLKGISGISADLRQVMVLPVRHSSFWASFWD